MNKLAGGVTLVSGAATVGDLRVAAASAEGVCASLLRLVASGSELCDDDVQLNEVVGELENVWVLARLLGGGKKRKKKTYTKPKKIKHKKKKEKMAVLKYYKITDDGKVERLRKECPADTCGAGIFMAKHADRHYCGKCSLTYVHEGKGSE